MSSAFSTASTNPIKEGEKEVKNVSFTIDSEGSKESLLASEVIEGKLWVGNFANAFDPSYLESCNFTHVLNVSGWGGLCCQRQWEKKHGKGKAAPVWKIVKVRDMPTVDITAVFPECFEFLDAAFFAGQEEGFDSKGSKVLLHCQAGVSRSATIAIAYLMHRHGLSLDAAYQRVLEARSIIKPNRGFLMQLLDFHKKLFNGSDEGSEICQKRLRLNYLVEQ